MAFVFCLLACLVVTGSAVWAQESMRIPRPAQSAGASAGEKLSEKQVSSDIKSSCCGSGSCSELPSSEAFGSSLPQNGLFAQWRAEFVTPTLCPVLLCHGSCARSNASCKFIKPILDSLLDAYLPEDVPTRAVLNFRCCAGFTEN